MPGSSALGDRNQRSTAPRSVPVTIHEDPQTPASTWASRAMTAVACVLLLGSGIAVGIWAAINEAAR